MTFIVEFMRYFEEFGWNDFDTKEFPDLKEAWNYYNEIKNVCEDVRLWAGQSRIA